MHLGLDLGVRGRDHPNLTERRQDDAASVDGSGDSDCCERKEAVPVTSGLVAAWRTHHTRDGHAAVNKFIGDAMYGSLH